MTVIIKMNNSDDGDKDITTPLTIMIYESFVAK